MAKQLVTLKATLVIVFIILNNYLNKHGTRQQ